MDLAKRLYLSGEYCVRGIADIFKVSRMAVWRCLNGNGNS
ncbi:TPA: helix-turn-helix domain-containing protein [Candidatus Micrarchaeota archaeon]|nr:helix-turn-helix domain-containing protein [Candidatus Micrarchaeota archaeon]